MYFYRPPSILDVAKKTRKAKHIDHYVGPATILKKIGSRSFQLSFVNPLTGIAQLLQRDAGMIILKKEWHAPSQEPDERKLAPAKHQSGMKPRVGEMVILRDYPDANDWYVAEICQVLRDRFTVNGYITMGLPLVGCARNQGRKSQGTEGNRFPAHMVKRQRQGHCNHCSTDSSQREREVLVEVEASSRRDGPATACEECLLGPRWIPEQGDQGPGSNIEVRTSCGGRRRGNSSVRQSGSSMEGIDCFLSLPLSFSCL